MNKKELAKEFIRLTKTGSVVDTVNDQVLRGMTSNFSGADPEILEDILGIVREVLEDHSPLLDEILVGAHVSTYSETELRSIVEFLSTDVGQSFLRNSEKMSAFVSGEINSYSNNVLVPDLQEKVRVYFESKMEEVESEMQEEE